MESNSFQSAESESKQVVAQQKAFFNCLAGVQKVLRASTEKLLWLSPWKAYEYFHGYKDITKFQVGHDLYMSDKQHLRTQKRVSIPLY